MRQQLEAQAGGRRAGVGIIGNEIVPADLDRVHPDPRGREINQTFGHRTRDGMADRAVLAHDILVLEHNAGAGAIILRHIGPADQIDDLVGFDGAGARVHRIGTDACEIVDLERHDGPVALDADPSPTAVVAGMNIRIEALHPVRDEFDRPAQQFRQRIGSHFVGVDMNLDAEGAADILADHANLRFLKAQMKGCDVLHHMRRLRALVDRQPRFGRVPVRHHRARLQRHAGVASKDEIRFHDFVGAGKGRIDRARIEVALKGKVVAERRMNDRRLRIERGAHVGHRLQFFICDGDDFGGVLRDGAARRHHGGDGLALPADAADRDRMLGCGFETLQMRQHADPRRDDGGEFLAGHDRDDAGHAPGLAGVDPDYFCVRMRRTDEHHMRHPRQFHVADIKPAPLHQPIEVGPRDRLADIGIRPIEHREGFRICR